MTYIPLAMPIAAIGAGENDPGFLYVLYGEYESDIEDAFSALLLSSYWKFSFSFSTGDASGVGRGASAGALLLPCGVGDLAGDDSGVWTWPLNWL